MSLLIKGMDMPKKDAGVSCRLYPYKDGTAQFTQYGRTPFDQPDNHYFTAVKIPIPHGDLIDRDKLIQLLLPVMEFPEDERIMYVDSFIRALKNAPTIIEAEQGDG